MIDIISGLYTTTVDAEHVIGSLHIDNHGNRYRYVKNGGVALVRAHLLQEAAEDTAFRSMVVDTASAIGANYISCTLGGTSTTAGMFDDGELIVESGTGLGQKYRITSHEVKSNATVCKFYIDRPLEVATVAANTNISVRKNAYMGVVDFPVTPTGKPVGVAISAIPISYYGWIQSGGDCAALFDTADNTAADESAIMPSRTVAGSVMAVTEAIAGPVHIGYGREQVSVDSTIGAIHLNID